MGDRLGNCARFLGIFVSEGDANRPRNRRAGIRQLPYEHGGRDSLKLGRRRQFAGGRENSRNRRAHPPLFRRSMNA